MGIIRTATTMRHSHGFSWSIPNSFALLAGETDGFSIDARYPGGYLSVKDTGTPANNRTNVLFDRSALKNAGTSNKIVRGDAGLLKTVPAGQIAQEFTSLGWGILIEPAATNLVTFSQTIDNAAWTNNNSTTTPDTSTAPDGTATADTMTATAGGAFVRQNFTTTAGQIYTGSCLFKAGLNGDWSAIELTSGTGNGVFTSFDLTNGVVGTSGTNGTWTHTAPATITSIGNGWYRCTVTTTVDVASTRLVLYQQRNNSAFDSQAGDTIFLWGAQAELGTIATSYIPTTSATVTRAADAIGCATSTYPHSNNAGTFIAWFRTIDFVNTNIRIIVAVHDGTANERHFLAIDNANLFRLSSTDGGVSQASLTAGVPSVAGNRAAVAYQLNNEGIVADGGAEVTDASCTMPTVTTFDLGNLSTAATNQLSGYIYQMTYVPRRMTEAEMQTRTR